jgi:Putative Ig domain
MASVRQAVACSGDCDGNGEVTVNELITGVNIALGSAGVDACPSFDRDSNGVITIDEILAAVNALLLGCPATPMPTATASATKTATPSVTATPTATLTPNQPPMLSALSLYRTYPGYPIQLAIGASDPDGDALTYAADTLPDGAQLDPATGVFSWMPTAEQLGPFYVPFSVSDTGQRPQSVQGELVFKVSPADPCTIATCDPANGCQISLVPLTAHCCAGVALPRVAEPVSDCPGARVAFLGRNVVAGFGKLQNCDQLKVVNFGQIGAAVRFNLETRCLRVEDAPVSVHVRIETTSLVRGAIVDDSTVANMQPGDNGYAQRLGLTFPVQPPGPFFDLDGAEANVTVTVTDFDQVTFTQSVRLVLISDPTKDLSDLPETP